MCIKFAPAQKHQKHYLFTIPTKQRDSTPNSLIARGSVTAHEAQDIQDSGFYPNGPSASASLTLALCRSLSLLSLSLSQKYYIDWI